MKPFEKWETDEVERVFGIDSVKKMPLMNDWLAFSQPLTQKEEERAEELRLFIEEFASSWNEEDMKVFFIVPVLQIVNFCVFGSYRAFMSTILEETLTDTQNNIFKLKGNIDMLVSKGKQITYPPFFFIYNQHKEKVRSISDPKGQLLIAMLAAQAKNNGLNLPIYGLYNIGQLWFFMVLVGKEYTTSKAFDATDKDDLKQIINALQYVKAHIERNV